MQVLKHSSILIHPLFNELERFYTATSEKVAVNRLVEYEFDESLKPLQDMFNEYGGTNYNFKFVDKGYKPLELPKFDENNVIVCFSGGKDSTAVAILYKNIGCNVYLYHIHGINKCYPNELEHAQEVADELGFPLIVENVSYSGSNDYIEHPLKNMMIAAMAISYGVNNGITNQIVVGNYLDETLDECAFYKDAGDCIDMWECFEGIMNNIYKDYQVWIDLDEMDNAYELVLSAPSVIPHILSCMGTYRFAEYRRQLNNNKFGINLLKGRCGCCIKCAKEYIYLCDHNTIYEYNEAYYKHCLSIIQKKIKEEQGEKLNERDVFECAFGYSIEESKYFGVKV